MHHRQNKEIDYVFRNKIILCNSVHTLYSLTHLVWLVGCVRDLIQRLLLHSGKLL